MGAMAAGLTPLWGIEYIDAIANVARRNLGDHIMTADIMTVDPSTLPSVDVLHASPPCPNFSVAKAGGKESKGDIALAAKVVEFIETFHRENRSPKIFTLEEVIAYRNSQSWRMIEDALHGAGYWVHWDHINTADYGVPQTRKRMIVRAIRGGWVPYLPQPVRWVGWYEAIEDLIPTLPDSKFAPWQLKRLPAELMESMRAFLCPSSHYSPIIGPTEPANTITADQNQVRQRAYLDHGRVVAMTPRCLARFQSFPDWYELPAKNELAARIIGNAVPPLLYQRIISPLLDSL